MSKIILSEDQEVVFNTISKWIATGDKVHPDQKSPNLLTLAGYAGTGKSTLTALIAKEFDKSVRFAFCALSGRAASVLGKKLRDQGVVFNKDGHYCGTIHRLIYQPVENEKGEIIHWAKKEFIDHDIIVVDEASMISENIFRDLTSYGKDILAVGDHGQLPPIEGKFSLMKNPILRLEKIHRQAQDNPIINLSMQVREEGKIPRNYQDNNKVSIIKKSEYIDFLRSFYQGIQDPEKLLDSAVLCYKNATRNKLNIMLRNIIFGSIGSVPLANDIVICLRNTDSYRKEVIYNGYRGYLLSGVNDYDSDFWEGKIRFPSEGFQVNVHNMLKYQFGYPKTFSSFSELEKFGMQIEHWSEAGLLFDYGYAITSHKFQGSQAETVILYNERPAPVDDDTYRRWAYTSVTRASEKLIIVL